MPTCYTGNMKVLNYTVKIHTAEEGGFWAEVPALPGCLTQGETVDEVIAMAKDAISGYLASLVKHGHDVKRSLLKQIIRQACLTEDEFRKLL